ncbi:MAG: phosphoadenosine phosphosulfate reductase family protein [Thermoproteota archaeon]
MGGLTKKITRAYKIFDRHIKPATEVVIAYSGGKDSTVLSILFYRWLLRSRVPDVSVKLLHNDTSSEIDPMEVWAREFMVAMQSRLQALGYETDVLITRPSTVDTFYWRVIVRGYPAPSFSFRWCVKLLKMLPTVRSLRAFLGSDGRKTLLLTGMREDESIARARTVKKRFGGCGLGPSKCTAYYLTTEDVTGITKLAPIRDWSNTDVWEFIRRVDDFQLSKLLYLYGCEEARYGCWHCTLVKVQWGLRALDKRYLYFDAVRLLYRLVSDIPSARLRKRTGYSRLGPLNAAARSLMLHLFTAAEELSGLRLYGLDEARISSGHTLRQLFYEMDEEEATNLILREDKTIDPRRFYPIGLLRNLNPHDELITRLHRKAESYIVNGFNPISEVLSQAVQHRLRRTPPVEAKQGITSLKWL